MLCPSETRTISKTWETTIMGINRRPLLVIGAALAGLSTLAGEAVAQSAGNPDLPKDAVILTAMVKAKPGQEDAVKEALLSLVEPTRKEPGCLLYNLHQSKTDPTLFMFYEQWASQEALDAHGKTPHMRALGAKLKDRTDKGGGVVRYELLK
jgi:quinol monooxygenase YgiN